MVDPSQGAALSWASERHLRLSFGAVDAAQGPARVPAALAAIEQARLPGLLAVTPAISTILLEFAPDPLNEQHIVEAVQQALATAVELPGRARTATLEIPVCYDPSCAPDLEELARFHGMDISTLVRLHSEPEYTVQFIGFAPGFGYLSGLPSRLVTPRLATPRVRVPAGSVGIAGEHTGVYPMAVAGGWRLIGRTTLTLFDAARERPSLLATGDRVRFVPIDLAEFNANLRGRSDHD